MRRQVTTYETTVGDLKKGDLMVANVGTQTSRSSVIEVVKATPFKDKAGNQSMELILQAVGFEKPVTSVISLRSEEHIIIVA